MVSTQRLERTVPLILQWDETFDIGADTGTPVDDRDYQVPFKFTGKINKLTVALDRPKLTPEDERSCRKRSAPQRMRSRPIFRGAAMIGRSVHAKNCNLIEGLFNEQRRLGIDRAYRDPHRLRWRSASPQRGGWKRKPRQPMRGVPNGNPGYADSGLSSPCTQVCVASGQWVQQYGPTGPGR